MDLFVVVRSGFVDVSSASIGCDGWIPLRSDQVFFRSSFSTRIAYSQKASVLSSPDLLVDR